MVADKPLMGCRGRMSQTHRDPLVEGRVQEVCYRLHTDRIDSLLREGEQEQRRDRGKGDNLGYCLAERVVDPSKQVDRENIDHYRMVVEADNYSYLQLSCQPSNVITGIRRRD